MVMNMTTQVICYCSINAVTAIQKVKGTCLYNELPVSSVSCTDQF